mmetsp:Transcript_32126/g.58749  ORF Transcript_32126/g.58749 Transcript_32126/m.58749 type:complete len:524 (-) Transcript_32126:27-1598(-)
MVAPASLLGKVLEEVKAGLVSSVVAEAALFPLDTVKLLQQIHGGTALQVFQGVMKQKGALGLYQGLIGRLIQTITSNVGFFMWQTILVQTAMARLQADNAAAHLSTGVSLVVNMLAQQFNRILTTPVDVVANVNQADPSSRGFFHTFVKLARTGGRPVLWRGLGLALVLSLNPALMFTLVAKLSALLKHLRKDESPLAAADMFWISGVSKAVATLVTYPLIRAKAVAQTSGAPGGIVAMLKSILQKEGLNGLYQGVWILSYKTILFNSLMMALKQKFSALLDRSAARPKEVAKTELTTVNVNEGWCSKTVLVQATLMPWEIKGSVIYVDGSWSHLHQAQEHLLKEASSRGDYMVVGVHSDQCMSDVMGSYPTECFSARIARLKKHPLVSAVVEDAPWEVTEDLLQQLGVSKVLAGSVSKVQDCQSPPGKDISPAAEMSDPYGKCIELGMLEVVESLNDATEHDIWLSHVQRIIFSNVDASIDWRILVKDGKRTPWGSNPGYQSESPSSPPLSPRIPPKSNRAA